MFDNTGLAPADSPDRVFPEVSQLPTGGPLDSKAINSTNSRVMRDIIEMQEGRSDILNKFGNLKTLVSQSAAWEQAAVRSPEEARVRARVDAQIVHLAGITAATPPAKYLNDLRLLRNITHQTGTLAYSLARRARVDAEIGQVVLPYVDMASLFHSAKPRKTDDPLFLQADAQVSEITPEQSLEWTQTDPRYSFNSVPDQFWMVRAAYPLASGVTEVTFDLTIQVPQQFAKEANVLRILPAPSGQVDIVDVLYSGTTATPTTQVPGIVAPDNEAAARAYYFAPTPMASITVRIRTRRWVEEAHHKVFYLGIEELDLQLVEVDSTFDSSSYGLGQNNGFFDVIELPRIPGILDSVILFNEVTGIRTSPGYSTSATATETNNGVHVMVFTDEDLTNPVWDSLGVLAAGPTLTPAAPLSVSAFNVDKLYLAVELDRLATGITPVLQELQLDYNVKV